MHAMFNTNPSIFCINLVSITVIALVLSPYNCQLSYDDRWYSILRDVSGPGSG
jgi:hypothetical protein